MVASSQSSTDWFSRNYHRILRLSGVLMLGTVAILLSRAGTTLFRENITTLLPADKTVTEVVGTMNGAETNGPPETTRAEKASDKDVAQHLRLISSESTSSRVWAYGLQLLTWAIMLGGTVWAVVTLCRDE